MVSIVELFRFENLEGLAIVVGVLLFVIAYSVIGGFMKERGVSIIISLIIALISSYGLYKRRFYEWEGSLAIILVIVIIFIFVKLFLPIWRNLRLSYGN